MVVVVVIVLVVMFTESAVAHNACVKECLRAHQLCVFLRVRLCDVVRREPLCATAVAAQHAQTDQGS